MKALIRYGSRLGLGITLACVLAACGELIPPVTGNAPTAGSAATGSSATGSSAAERVDTPAAVAPRDLPSSTAEASRFLTKSTFGSTQPEIDRLMQVGYSSWIDEQFEKSSRTHLANVAELTAKLTQTSGFIDGNWMQYSFWRNALRGEDVLRQRVAYALSQVFVVSQVNLDVTMRMSANHLDILARNAFGNFRTLLEEVSLSPAMGVYLTHLANEKTDLAFGRLPDENYAREIMQLFTIGLVELNPDGSMKLGTDGLPMETYGIADIQGLAKVFTGFSWGGPDNSDARFINRLVGVSDRDILPMQGYPQFHETGPKSFLGKTINTSVPQDSLKQALDILFNHPNVGPFFGRLMIQRLVTSNPSPAYVGRVAAAFADNGKGVRGDMKAVIRAVLLDPEASNPPAASASVNGRLREPILRMSTLLRALDATSTSNEFRVQATDDPSTSLGQSPMRAPSVFNFYRPGYVPPNSEISKFLLAGNVVPVAPELQITNEVSAAGWVKAARAVLDSGIGYASDVKPNFAPLVAMAHTPSALVDRLILLMAPGGQIPMDLRNEIVATVSTVSLPTTNDADKRKDRVKLATLLLVVSPEFMLRR
jgi:uncharacterized protein (DUF1800 family)